jgi:hypothetical protein
VVIAFSLVFVPDSLFLVRYPGINTLLRRWDASRNIERSQIYQDLSVTRKIGMLSHIALKAFERSEIFFKKQTLTTYIADYIVNLPDRRKRKLLPFEMEVQAEKVLKSIEAQHGLLVERAHEIYSFSHLSFQEYFAAYAISYERDLEKLQLVFEQVKNKQWNEVFVLAIAMSPCADDLLLLMKQKADEILKDEPKLLDFLVWLNRKARKSKAKLPQYFIRAFYYMYFFSPAEVISSVNTQPLHPDMDLDRALINVLNTCAKLAKVFSTSHQVSETIHNVELNLQAIDQMLQQTASVTDNTFQIQWQHIMTEFGLLRQAHPSEDGLQRFQNWLTNLRQHTISHRDIGHDWNFSIIQLDKLQEYYNANKLLMDCLSGDCYVNRQLQREIRGTLFGVGEHEESVKA